jgi:hypothetical protein
MSFYGHSLKAGAETCDCGFHLVGEKDIAMQSHLAAAVAHLMPPTRVGRPLPQTTLKPFHARNS